MEYPQALAQAREIALPAGQVLFRQGDRCENYLLLLEGSVRVFARSPQGKEVLLYRMASDEVCVLTTSCLLGQQRYPAEAIAETAIRAKMLSSAQFEQFLDSSVAFRRFVFAGLGARLASLVGLVEQIALEGIDSRLAALLLKRADTQRHLQLTHQQIAVEIGSAREVISRHLKQFEKAGWLRLERGSIVLLDSTALQALTQLEA